MTETIEKLWNEYFAESCSGIETAEEKVLIKRVIETHKALHVLLTKEQNDTMETHMEAVYEMQGSFVKKAFMKGCEFALSFALEAGVLKRE